MNNKNQIRCTQIDDQELGTVSGGASPRQLGLNEVWADPSKINYADGNVPSAAETKAARASGSIWNAKAKHWMSVAQTKSAVKAADEVTPFMRRVARL